MLELINVWDLYKTGNCDVTMLDMTNLKCFYKLSDDYSYIFQYSVRNGTRNGAECGGKDCYERVNETMRYDVPDRPDILLKDDNDYDKFKQFLQEGHMEYNKRVVAELTKTYKAKKAAENYKIAMEQREKQARFQCEVCDPPCYTNSSSVWEAHITTRAHIKNTNGDPRLYTCDACGEEFENTKLRNRHVDALKCFQSRTCKDCGSTLSSKQRYQEHFINGICNVLIKQLINSGQLQKIGELKCSNSL